MCICIIWHTTFSKLFSHSVRWAQQIIQSVRDLDLRLGDRLLFQLGIFSFLIRLQLLTLGEAINKELFTIHCQNTTRSPDHKAQLFITSDRQRALCFDLLCICRFPLLHNYAGQSLIVLIIFVPIGRYRRKARLCSDTD